MKPKRIIPLGTGGWIPTETRQTTCIALQYDQQLVLLDAGSGVARCLHPDMQSVIERATDVWVILSHFHLDHIIGLTFAPLVFRGKRVTICGPGSLCAGATTTEDALRRAFSRPFFSLPLDEFPVDLQIRDLTLGENELDNLGGVVTRQQTHPDSSIGIRIDDVAFVTDTGCDDATVQFARDAKVLFHDAYYDESEYEVLQATPTGMSDRRNHGHASGVADIARRANVTRAYLIHLNPNYDERRLAAMEKEARGVFQTIELGRDMEHIIP